MKKITLESIAQELGTTRNTVSKALRGMPGVGEELRGRVIGLAEEYGYKRKGRQPEQELTQVTIITNDRLMDDRFFWPTVLSGIFEYATQYHVGIRTVIVDMLRDDMQYFPPLQEKYCDGILVIGTIPDALFMRVARLGIPIVAMDHYSARVECDYVNVANQDGARKAMEFLAGHGHRKIGFINHMSAPYTHSFTQRYQGYCSEMEKRGLPIEPHFIWPDSRYEDNQYYRDQLDMLAAYGDAPTAWMCANDLTAYNFCAVLAERGLRVPHDVSVVGFDNVKDFFQSELTTLEIPQKAMGRRALQRLMYRLRHPDEPYESIEIFTRLIDRGSVRAL